MNDYNEQSAIELGMYYTGRSLRYLRKGDIKGLKNKIQEKLRHHFNVDFDNNPQLWKGICRGAAKSLMNSKYFWWRSEYAAMLCEEVGLKRVARRLHGKAKRGLEIAMQINSLEEKVSF